MECSACQSVHKSVVVGWAIRSRKVLQILVDCLHQPTTFKAKEQQCMSQRIFVGSITLQLCATNELVSAADMCITVHVKLNPIRH